MLLGQVVLVDRKRGSLLLGRECSIWLIIIYTRDSNCCTGKRREWCSEYNTEKGQLLILSPLSFYYSCALLVSNISQGSTWQHHRACIFIRLRANLFSRWVKYIEHKSPITDRAYKTAMPWFVPLCCKDSVWLQKWMRLTLLSKLSWHTTRSDPKVHWQLAFTATADTSPHTTFIALAPCWFRPLWKMLPEVGFSQGSCKGSQRQCWHSNPI